MGDSLRRLGLLDAMGTPGDRHHQVWCLTMIRGPLSGLERQVMAVERVERVLRETTAALERAGIE